MNSLALQEDERIQQCFYVCFFVMKLLAQRIIVKTH